MKFEKLNENKIRIILSNQDLADKNIDFNSFMSNSAETQTLFLDMLEEAEEKVGFITRDHKIKIEALSVRELVSLQRRCSNNLNQVAIQANTYSAIYPEELAALQRDYAALWGPLSDLLKQLSALVEL